MQIPLLKIANLMGKTGLGKITQNLWNLVTQEVTKTKMFLKSWQKYRTINPLLAFAPKTSDSCSLGLLPGQVDVDFHCNLHKIKNMALGIVFFFHYFIVLVQGKMIQVLYFLHLHSQASLRHLSVERMVPFEAIKLVNVFSEERYFVDFKLRSVFIAKTFSFNHFKTVTCWEKPPVSQHYFHVLPTSFPYLPMVY